jgi:hypothetical protein
MAVFWVDSLIRQEIAAIPADTSQRVFATSERPVQLYIDAEDDHFQHLRGGMQFLNDYGMHPQHVITIGA